MRRRTRRQCGRWRSGCFILHRFFKGALPHHNEIAVDEFPKKMAKADYKIQNLYDPPTYAKQFTYRYNTARNHILQVFSENWSP